MAKKYCKKNDGGDVNIPDQQVCTGPFTDSTLSDSWFMPWTAIFTSDTGAVAEDFLQLGDAITTTDCITDITVAIGIGNGHLQLRDAEGLILHDIRIKVNGVIVHTRNLVSEYQDNVYDQLAFRNLKYNIGFYQWHRHNVPANSEITVEVRRRYNFIMGNGAVVQQARVRSGNNGFVNVTMTPQQIVTGRV